MASLDDSADETSMGDVPDEILEFILSLTSPYRDYKAAMLVCKRWHKVMQSVSSREYTNFVRAVGDHSLEWQIQPPEESPTITERYSHSACYHDRSMYVFGGCTFSSTTFNDLWRFDLATREWVRPLATGTYPSPKACASLVSVGDHLYLFGGWSHPTPYTFHQASKFFSQLHSYDPSTNKWAEIFTDSGPCGKAGHGVSVVEDKMVVFGGYHGHGTSSNEVWIFNTSESCWERREIHGTRPLPRYGHCQLLLDAQHILIIGGCGGPNMLFNDVWALDMSGPVWSWHEIQVLQQSNGPHQLWCHGGCLVDDKVVFLCKTNRAPKSPPPSAKAPLPRHARAWGPRHDDGAHGGRLHAKTKRSHPETSESSSQESSSDQEDGAGIGRVSLHSPMARARLLHGGKPGPTRGLRPSADSSFLGASAGPLPGPSAEANPGPHYIPGFGQPAGPSSEPTPGPSSEPNPGPPHIQGFGPSPGPSSEPTPGPGHPHLPGFGPTGGPPHRPGFGPPPGPPHRAAFGPPPGLGGALGPPRPGLPSVRPNAMKNRQKQLETLKRYEAKIKEQMKPASSSHVHQGGGGARGGGGGGGGSDRPPPKAQNPMYIHMIDVSAALTRKSVSWLPIADFPPENAPEETIFYSLIHGRGELILFGGIQTDLNSMQRGLTFSGNSQVVKNTTSFLQAVKSLR